MDDEILASRSAPEETREGVTTSQLDEILREILPEIEAAVRLRQGRLFRRRADAADIVQEACADLWRSGAIGAIRDASHVKALLLRGARRKLVQHCRRHRAAKRDRAREASTDSSRASAPGDARLHDVIGTPSQHAMAAEIGRRIEEELAHLPPLKREVIVLAKCCGLDNRDIAERLGRSVDAVKSTLSRGMADLAIAIARS
jgi:RNA polymerase sigma factor (sigma-70 family)